MTTHLEKPCHLNNLGFSFTIRFEKLEEVKILEDAISAHRDAIYLISDGYPYESCHLNRSHLDTPGCIPDGHPDKPGGLNNLGLSSVTRIERLGELRDLEEAISAHRDAVHLTPGGHPDKPVRLNILGLSFRACFSRLGEPRDLEEAISTPRDAVRLTPDDHPDKPGRHLNNLGLFQSLDLEAAFLTPRDAVCIIPESLIVTLTSWLV